MKKVLVVDDSNVVRNFHINILKSAGFEADGAVDGMDALEKSLTTNFDVILCDINMPNMDGLTFVKNYREEEKETPIIIISTQEEQIHKNKAYDTGANIFITKPVKPTTLLLHIDMITEFA